MSKRINIRVTSDVDKFAADMIQGARTTLPEAMEDLAPDALRIMVQEVRKYIPAEHRKAPGQMPTSLSTGRLYSSFGLAVIQSNNPEFNPNDAVKKIHRKKARDVRIHIEAGTNVPYARNANYGIPSIRYGYTLTQPYFFMEKGSADAEVKIKQLYQEQTEEKTRQLAQRRLKGALKRDKRAVRRLILDPDGGAQIKQYVEI